MVGEQVVQPGSACPRAGAHGDLRRPGASDTLSVNFILLDQRAGAAGVLEVVPHIRRGNAALLLRSRQALLRL
jgi:hypothetical protein